MPPIPLLTVVDAILLLVVLEGGALALWRRRTGRGPAIAQVVSFLGAGGALLVALRAALAGWPLWVALVALGAAGAAHAAHLALDSRR
ncbi:MAG TPA: hypothetical protein VEZ47_02375 [Gemmatirosa sp.]|jgi:hypothetical protein|nr:hypothetical protein [Gemmatirosa sp.]